MARHSKPGWWRAEPERAQQPHKAEGAQSKRVAKGAARSGGVVRNLLAVVLLKLHLNKGLRENFWVNPHYPHLSTLQLLQQ